MVRSADTPLPLGEVNGKVGPDWFSTGKARTALGCTAKQWRELVDAGIVTRHPQSDGRVLYDPAELEEARRYLEELGDEERAERKMATALGNGEPLRQAVEMARVAHVQANAMFRLFHDPTLRAMRMMSRENRALRLRCRELEQRETALFELREQLESQAVERRLREQRETFSQQRKNEAFALLKTRLPGLVDQMLGSASSPEQARKLKAALDLLGSFQPEQFEGLLMTDFVSPEQKRAIRSYLGREPEVEKPVESAPNAEAAPKKRRPSK